MKKSMQFLVAIIALIGLLVIVALPFYLMFSSVSLISILPRWFVLTNFVLAIVIMILIIIVGTMYAYDKHK